MTVAIYPGTFDPLTNGHLDIIQRAARLFDTVIIAMATNEKKGTLFSLEERMHLGKRLLTSMPNVNIQGFSGLLIDFAKTVHADLIIRGIRSSTDIDHEWQLARMNRHLNNKLETLLMLPSESTIHISSYLVKEVFHLGGNISTLVPALVMEALETKRMVRVC